MTMLAASNAIHEVWPMSAFWLNNGNRSFHERDGTSELCDYRSSEAMPIHEVAVVNGSAVVDDSCAGLIHTSLANEYLYFLPASMNDGSFLTSVKRRSCARPDPSRAGVACPMQMCCAEDGDAADEGRQNVMLCVPDREVSSLSDVERAQLAVESQ